MAANWIRLNGIYQCKDKEKLEQYREKLYMAIKGKSDEPEESELPEIRIEGNKEIDLTGNYGEPYYSEIDIGLINSTNTSSCGQVYSDYDRVKDSICCIIKDECRPIAVVKDGDNYYISNGKHRFLAYTLLGKDFIPVSIQEKITEKENASYSMIEYKKALYFDDEQMISYPEQVMEFYKEHKELFKDISHVEMKCLEQNKKYRLELKNKNGDSIEIKNGISAGNENRSSRVVKELISNCGYDIDMEFIKKHQEFVLKCHYDAHNIVFDTNIFIDKSEQDYILERKAEWREYSPNLELQNQKIWKLHGFLSKYKEFGTAGTSFTFHNSGMIYNEDKEAVYYFVGSDNVKDKGNYTYIFKDKGLTKSNLKVQYLGRAGEDSVLSHLGGY